MEACHAAAGEAAANPASASINIDFTSGQSVVIEILKIILPLLGGGAVGALLNEWLRRRGARVQAIPLIERVNRPVSPELKGLTLARLTGDGQTRRLEEIKNVREYQFTLRNTSTVHLQDVEIPVRVSDGGRRGVGGQAGPEQNGAHTG